MNISLYIHIPFCRSKCDYCDFFSVPCGKKDISDEYVSALCREIDTRCRSNNIEVIDTVYIGGGTPSLLKVSQLEMISKTFRKYTKVPVSEFTVEVNPDDVTEDLLAMFQKCGVTRLSCGVQAFEENVLSGVKRRSSGKTVVKALEVIKNNWKGIFSADIISALPGQTEESFLQGVKKLISYKPEHISLYSLTIEDETPLGKAVLSNRILYDFDKADDMWLLGKKLLEKNGYKQYEVSNFCFAGYEAKHNMVYWQLKNYIGCGAGATGSRYGDYGVRFTNTENISEYCSFWNSEGKTIEKAPGIEEKLSLEIQSFEFIMMGLRTLNGINLVEYKERFHREIPEKIKAVMHEWAKNKRAEYKAGLCFSLTSEGLLFLNEFLRQII